MASLPDENQKRFVAILNKKMDLGRTLNVLGHISVGLSDLLEQSDAEFVDYYDKDKHHHPNISHYPFIVLKAPNSNKIRTIREQALELGIQFTDFTHTMIEGGSIAQQQTTSETKDEDFEYLGICLFGDTETIKGITKKFSLYK